MPTGAVSSCPQSLVFAPILLYLVCDRDPSLYIEKAIGVSIVDAVDDMELLRPLGAYGSERLLVFLVALLTS